MALSERLALLIEADPTQAIKSFEATAAAAEKNLGVAQTRTQKMGTEFTRYGSIMLATSAVVGVGLYAMAKAHDDAHRNTLILQNTLATAPQLAGANQQAFLDLADSLQGLTAVDNDAIVGMEGLLGQFGLTQDQILEVTPLVVDLAQKMGIDLNTAAKMVGKAIEGKAGALGKAGILLDETAYKTDKYGAVTDALRHKVGGFAEVEGRTFEGQLKRLKNELGDVAEGIGGGVAGAMATLLKPVSFLSDMLGKLSPQTQSAIGTFLTFAIAAVAVAGAISFVTGKLELMSARFIVAAGSAGVFGTSLTAVGFATASLSGALGLVGLAIAAYTMFKHDATKATEEFTNAILADNGALGPHAQATSKVHDMFGKIAGSAAKAGVSYEQFTGALGAFDSVAMDASDAMGDIEYARSKYGDDAAVEKANELVAKLREEGGARNELIATMIANGEASAHLGQQLDSLFDEADKNKQVASELAVTGAQVAGTMEDEQRAAQGLTGDLGAQADAQQHLMDIQLGAFDSNIALQNANLSFQDSIWKVEDAQTKLNDAVAQYGPGSREAQQATNDLIKAQLDQETAAQRVAAAQVQLAVDQAAVNGQTVDAASQALIYKQTLQDMADKTSGPVHDALQGMVDQLNSTTGTWPIDLVLTPNAEYVINRMNELRETGQYLNMNHYASGGYMPPNQLSVVGENGPELFISSAGGHVIPNHMLRNFSSDGRAVGGGATINITVHAGMGADGRSIADTVVAEMQKWSRRNGPIPVATR